jgi:hypothetical protein
MMGIASLHPSYALFSRRIDYLMETATSSPPAAELPSASSVPPEAP